MYPPGSVVKVFRISKGVHHFGICTDQGTVIDHTIEGIKERPFKEFAQTGAVEIANPQDSEARRSNILERAYHALFNYSKTPYKLFKMNCEHFTSWCRKGVLESKQVQIALIGFSVVAFVGAVWYLTSRRSAA